MQSPPWWRCAICLAAVFRMRRLATAPAVAGLSMTLFGAWNAFAAGWLLMHGRVWDDLIQVSYCSLFISEVLGLLLLFLLLRFRGC